MRPGETLGLPSDHRAMPDRRCARLEAFDGNADALVFESAENGAIAGQLVRGPALIDQVLMLGREGNLWVRVRASSAPLPRTAWASRSKAS